MRKPSSQLRRILADNVRTYRAKHGLSQEELADACGMHRTYIGSVERCERNVTLSTLEALATALRGPGGMAGLPKPIDRPSRIVNTGHSSAPFLTADEAAAC